MSTIETVTRSTSTITLSAEDGPKEERKEETYKYAHLLPHSSRDTYPPLEPFDHVDPALRALKHPDPRAFLNAATSVIELTPNLGTEIRGIHLTALDSDARDQLALEVTRNSISRVPRAITC
jgi:sulfonate dioxygenase